jgi:transposase
MKTKIPAVERLTIGLDLGDRRHAACVLSASGEILAEEAITNTRECLTAFAQKHPGATFVMETGTHSPWVSRLLESLGHRVIVANAPSSPASRPHQPGELSASCRVTSC